MVQQIFRRFREPCAPFGDSRDGGEGDAGGGQGLVATGHGADLHPGPLPLRAAVGDFLQGLHPFQGLHVQIFQGPGQVQLPQAGQPEGLGADGRHPFGDGQLLQDGTLAESVHADGAQRLRQGHGTEIGCGKESGASHSGHAGRHQDLLHAVENFPPVSLGIIRQVGHGARAGNGQEPPGEIVGIDRICAAGAGKC